MKKFLLEGLLYPFLAILFCLAFGVPFTFAGFQTIQVSGTKVQEIANFDVTHAHFWGLYKVHNHIEGVNAIPLMAGSSKWSSIQTASFVLQ